MKSTSREWWRGFFYGWGAGTVGAVLGMIVSRVLS